MGPRTRALAARCTPSTQQPPGLRPDPRACRVQASRAWGVFQEGASTGGLLRVGDPGSCEASGTQSDFLQQQHTSLKFPFC